MNTFAFVLVIVQAVLLNNAYSQVIRAGSCGCGLPGPITIAQPTVAIAQPSVAASLADTLSLLTVSSLLAESLPLNPNVIAVAPSYAPACGAAYAPAYAYDGCGCGCGLGGLGYGYSYIL